MLGKVSLGRSRMVRRDFLRAALGWGRQGRHPLHVSEHALAVSCPRENSLLWHRDNAYWKKTSHNFRSSRQHHAMPGLANRRTTNTTHPLQSNDLMGASLGNAPVHDGTVTTHPVWLMIVTANKNRKRTRNYGDDLDRTRQGSWIAIRARDARKVKWRRG